MTLVSKFLKVVNIATITSLYIYKSLFCCGDIETNLFPKCSSLLFFHWNLYGLTAHSFNKFYLLQAHIAPHELDIDCISETFLTYSFKNDGDRLTIDRYNLKSDNPSNLKKDRVCIYHKEHIPLVRKDDLCT